MSLDIKHRPSTTREFAGNKPTITAIESLLQERDNFPHAILITGPTGCGKTTLARIVAKELEAIDDDYREIDSAQFNGIDTIRDLNLQTRFGPRHPKSRCRVWLIDEAHQMGTGGASEKNKAQNAMLKMLEDAPDYIYFILCTTDPQMLLKTVRGRCTHFEVDTLSEKEISTLLKKVCRKERKKITDEMRGMISLGSDGHPRNALKLLEKVINLDEETAIELLKKEKEKSSQAIELCRALIQGDNWRVISGILLGLKNEDEEKLRRMILSYCNSVLLKGTENEQAFVLMEEMEEPFYSTGKPGLTLACYRAIVGISNSIVPF